MLYCDLCADEKRWPTTMFGSYGTCEVCGKARVCNDVPSSQLPMGVRRRHAPGELMEEPDLHGKPEDGER